MTEVHNNSCVALLVMVHGSPRATANESMFRVIDLLKERGCYSVVEVGFMECNEPTIPEAIARCIERGATEVIAVPYFLHTGTHVADDLPGLLEEAHEQYPGITFRLGGFLGSAPTMAEILFDRAEAVR